MPQAALPERVRRRRSRRWLLVAAVYGVIQASAAHCAPDTPARVLVMFSGHRLLPAAVTTEQSFRATLDSGSTRPIDYYYEAVDEHRNPSLQYESAFVSYLTEKYSEQPPDLIFAVHALALEFVLHHRTRVWPDTPVVFAGVDEQRVQELALGPNVTGITESVDWAGTLDLAARLQPDARRVVVVGGVSEYDRRWLPRVDQALRRYEGRFEVSYLIDRSFEQLLEEVARLPRDTIVLHTTVFRDAAGRTFVPREVTEKLASASGAPSYAGFSTHLGNGIVGGSVIDIAAQGRGAAVLALRILGGEHAADIPAGPVPNITMVDWRQLRRFGIGESELPPGSEIRFRPPSPWDQYRWQVVVGLALVLVQAALIFWLLFERGARRRAAEQAAKASVETGVYRENLAHLERVHAVGEMSAALAHEINQPLVAIENYALAARRRVAEKPPDSAKVVDLLDKLIGQASRAGDVVKRLRGMVKRHDVEPRAIDVECAVRECVEMVKGDCELRDIALELKLAGDLPAVLADEVQIQQVVLNLLRNAIDAVELPGPDVRKLISIETSLSGEGGVSVQVADHGPGIAEGDLERVFEAFYTTKATGLGIGLAICRKIIEAYGGALRALRNPTGGAVFQFTLPVPELED